MAYGKVYMIRNPFITRIMHSMSILQCYKIASTFNIQVQRTTLCANLDGLTDMKIIVTRCLKHHLTGTMRILHAMHMAVFS